MKKVKKYAEGGELPQAMVDRMVRESNKSDRELVTKPAKAIVEGVKKMYGAATGKDAKDFEPAKRTRATGYTDEDGMPQRETKAPTDAVTSPVGGRGNEVRSLNMGKKAQKEGFDDFKKGGKVSKAVMQKAGFYDKDKSKKERQEIVKKVTTKPQRVAIVEKAFSSKNMNEGGKVSSASKRADGCAIRGKTRA